MKAIIFVLILFICFFSFLSQRDINIENNIKLYTEKCRKAWWYAKIYKRRSWDMYCFDKDYKKMIIQPENFSDNI